MRQFTGSCVRNVPLFCPRGAVVTRAFVDGEAFDPIRCRVAGEPLPQWELSDAAGRATAMGSMRASHYPKARR